MGCKWLTSLCKFPYCLTNSRMVLICACMGQNIYTYCFLKTSINYLILLFSCLAPTAPSNCDIKKGDSTSIRVSWDTPYPFDYKVEFYKVKVQDTFNIFTQ